MLKRKTVLFVIAAVSLSLIAFANTRPQGFKSIRDPFLVGGPGEQQQPLRSILVHIHYRKAKALAVLIGNRDRGMLSERGRVNADPRTNTLWIYDEPGRLAAIGAYLKKVDIPAKQIAIEAWVVNIDKNFSRTLGLRFGTSRTTTQDVKTNDGLNFNIPAMQSMTTFQPGELSLTVARLAGDAVLALELSAMESEGHGKVISNPKLITVNRETATIEAGDEVPYQEKTGEGNTAVVFKKAVLSLKVTPEINEGGKILLHIKVNQDKVSDINVGGVPAISTRALQTQVELNDGQTVVLGGIYETTKNNRIERVPFFGNLPVLGALFRRKETRTEQRELMIFITPRVLG